MDVVLEYRVEIEDNRCSQLTMDDRVYSAQLPNSFSSDEITGDWDFHRREASHLLVAGQQGRWVIISQASIIGVWDTEEQAQRAAGEHALTQPYLLHQVQERAPVLYPPEPLAFEKSA